MSKYVIKIPSINEITNNAPDTELIKRFNKTLSDIFETKSFNEYIKILLSMYISKISDAFSDELAECIASIIINNTNKPEDLSIIYFASPELIMSMSIKLEFNSTFNINKDDLIKILTKEITDKCKLNDTHTEKLSNLLTRIIE